MPPDTAADHNRQEVPMDPHQLILAPLLDDPPPRTFEWYTWAEDIETAIKAQTPAFRQALTKLLTVARDRHQRATGTPARFLSLKEPTAILGPKWRANEAGNYGAFNSLWVLRDPKLGPSEFGLAY